MKRIKFFGASGGVTGSCYVVTADDDTKFMVDFGMFQGLPQESNLNYEKLAFRPNEIKAVFITHAHLDHIGRLPLLVFGGFFGKIYMTAPTFSLMDLSLTDSAKVARENIGKPALYDIEEVAKVLQMVEVIEYDKPFQVGNLLVTYKDAGHILGSASVEIADSEKIVFSGDLGNSPEDIVRPTTYIDEADYVVIESTYGDSIHPKEDQSGIIQEEINKVEQLGGVLLIPAFSLERTQELLHRIHHLKKDGKVSGHTPVFMDSPMAVHATVIFKDFKNFYNDELQSHSDDPFSFEGLVVTEEVRDSKEIIRAMSPKVIIAGSGMMSGGRILHHAINYLGRENTRVLFVGYQAEETLGRKILEGAKNVMINDEPVKVNAKVREIKSMSSHADQPNLLEWLKHINGVKKVFVTHGDKTQREMFANVVKQQTGIESVILPQIGDEHDL